MIRIWALFFTWVFLSLGSLVVQAQAPTPSPTPEPTKSLVIVDRYAFGPNGTGYKLVEAWVEHKDGWIGPDVGYIDFRTARTYRELFIGFGKTLYTSQRATVVGELYYDQATGPAAQSAAYIQPWVSASVKPTKKDSIEGVYFPYLPISKHAVRQHVLERIKYEHDFSGIKVGGGYSGYKFGDTPWQNKPFVAVTFPAKSLGSFEVWGQKVPGGFQIQVRHAISFKF